MSLERLFPRPGKKIRYRPVSMQFFYMLFISRFIILLYLFCIQTCLYLFGHLLYTGTDLSLFVTLSSICWNRLVFTCYAIFYILEHTCLYLFVFSLRCSSFSFQTLLKNKWTVLESDLTKKSEGINKLVFVYISEHSAYFGTQFGNFWREGE